MDAQKKLYGWMGNITVVCVDIRKGRITRESYPVGPPQSTPVEALAHAEMAGRTFLKELGKMHSNPPTSGPYGTGCVDAHSDGTGHKAHELEILQ